jgi:hypothetical protein
VAKRGEPLRELYDLSRDPGETTNVIEDHPDVEAELAKRLDACREDLGDALTGAEGLNCRPIGTVEDPKPLTEYEAGYPYIAAEYDLPDAG